MDAPAPSMVQDRHLLTGTLFPRSSSRALRTEEHHREARTRALGREGGAYAGSPHGLQGAIERSLINNRAAVARMIGLTRARVTQFVDVLLLAPDLQARVLGLKAVDGAEQRPSGRSRPWRTREAGPRGGGR